MKEQSANIDSADNYTLQHYTHTHSILDLIWDPQCQYSTDKEQILCRCVARKGGCCIIVYPLRKRSWLELRGVYVLHIYASYYASVIICISLTLLFTVCCSWERNQNKNR
jgi:hypothetical protein